MRQFRSAALAAIALTAHATASAQSLDDAHATVNRLLDGAATVLVFDTGRTLESVHGPLSNVRTAGRCETSFKMTYPAHADIPGSYHGKSFDADHDWADTSNVRVEGDHVFYDSTRERTGRPFTYHYQFSSSSAAQQFGRAAAILIEACQSGEDDAPQLEEAVHDPRGNTASLAIDRRNGSRYGWAVDYQSVDEADRRALAECERDGSNCHVVLRFTGGCGAYAADSARGSTAYGWGTAPTRAAAESRARSEARERGGTDIVTRVWGCNSVKPATAGAAERTAVEAAKAAEKARFEEALREHAETVRAHQEAVEQYQRQIEANQSALQSSAERGRAAQQQYEQEMARTRAAQEQYERERQAYREEYRRVTGRYPDE